MDDSIINITTSNNTLLGVPNTAKYINTLLPQQQQVHTQSLYNMMNTKDDVIYKDIIDKVIRPPLILSAIMSINKKRKNNISEQDHIDLSKINILKNADVLIKPTTTINSTSSTINIESSNNIGNPLEPSIIFATITNTYENITCMHINSTITQLVTGHKDNCVRIFRLNHKEKYYFGRHLKQKLGNSLYIIFIFYILYVAMYLLYMYNM